MHDLTQYYVDVLSKVAARLDALLPAWVVAKGHNAMLAVTTAADPHIQQLMPHLLLARTALEPYVAQGVATAVPYAQHLTTQLDNSLAGLLPWQILLLTSVFTVIVLLLVLRVRLLLKDVRRQGVALCLFAFLRSLPILKQLVNMAKNKMRLELHAKHGAREGALRSLPAVGLPAAAVLERLRQKAVKDVHIPDGHSMLSGTVYIRSSEHKQLLDEAYSLFSITNPLHTDVFPSVPSMEADVVAMVAVLMGGGPKGGNPGVCGAMTSGGTESILTAIKASRDYMQAKRGIREPEMIIAASAHAAYFKAAEYFNIRLVRLAVGRDLRLSGAAVRRALTRNTIVVVASAPGFPHGVVDHVEDIAGVTRRAGVCLHVDGCLGGLVLPFARRLGYPVPKFDFSVAGVTSMSVDTHKFGMAHKGTSVVLYSSPDIRRQQYTSIVDWSGGLYISPGMAGSRPGGLIATAWASLVHLGEEGLMAATDSIMRAASSFQRGLAAIPELSVLGRPEGPVVAFASASRSLDIYVLNDLLTQRGWHLNALQHPAALHFCFTAAHSEVVPDLLAEIKRCVAVLKADPKAGGKGGSAALYGAGNVSPDRGLLGEFLALYQDSVLH